MTSGAQRLAFSDVFGILFVGSWVAAISIAVILVSWSTLTSGFHLMQLLYASIFAMFAMVVFLSAILIPSILFWLAESNLQIFRVNIIRWSFFIVTGTCVGLVLSIVTVYPAQITSLIGAISGFFAGATCAWLWGSVKRYRIHFSIDLESEGRALFLPSWLGKRKIERSGTGHD
jgi:hypothetical protein